MTGHLRHFDGPGIFSPVCQFAIVTPTKIRQCDAVPTRTPGPSEISGHSGPTYEKSLIIYIRKLLTKTKCFALSSAPCSLDILPRCLLVEASLKKFRFFEEMFLYVLPTFLSHATIFEQERTRR